MKNLMTRIFCALFPMFLIRFLVRNKYLKQHPYPPSTLIHRGDSEKGCSTVLFEIEFNWYDHELNPVSIVRQCKTGKQFSVSFFELLEFREFQGKDRTAGNTINDYKGSPR